MENRKLISMTDYVLAQMEINSFDEDKTKNIWEYAKFLKTPLTINLFVPAVFEDGSWTILDDKEWKQFEGKVTDFEAVMEKFKKAKESVIFEGFEIITPEKHKIISLGGTTFISKSSFNVFYKKEWKEDWETDFSNIEALVKYNLTLTESKSKQLSLSNNI